MRYSLLVILMLPLPASAQTLSLPERAALHARQTAVVLTSCQLDRSMPVAAPDTVRYVWGYDRVLRMDWSCRYGVQGGAIYIAARQYLLPPGKVLCTIVEDRGSRKRYAFATGVIPCEAFEQPK